MIEKLLDWANANYGKSINLPSKPHAVIALNKSDHATSGDQWNSVTATANLLKSMSAQIDKNSTFRQYTAKWDCPERRIRDMDDLLRCYYSTVHVVRLPDKSRFQKMLNQRNVLYEVITRCCNDSRDTKRDRNMLPDVDELGLYLSLAFDHFSETLDKPFDHVEASLKLQPPPDSLTDNLKYFIRMYSNERLIAGDITKVFEEITPMVASCFMLDATRHRLRGKWEV